MVGETQCAIFGTIGELWVISEQTTVDLTSAIVEVSVWETFTGLQSVSKAWIHTRTFNSASIAVKFAVRETSAGLCCPSLVSCMDPRTVEDTLSSL